MYHVYAVDPTDEEGRYDSEDLIGAYQGIEEARTKAHQHPGAVITEEPLGPALEVWVA